MDSPWKSSPRVLDPIGRVSEVLFGLIMVLTFTGSLSVATAGHAEVRAMLVGAIGCNSLGRMTGYHRWAMGIGMVALGSLLAAMTMALGG